MLSFLRHLFLPHESNNQRAKLLHPSAISLVIGVFILFQFSLNFFSTHYPQILGYAAQISPEEIISLTNQQRQANGAGPLSLDSQLSAAAAAKAADMFARDYWAHVSPVGTQPWFFITQSGYSYRYAGENLARDFSDPQSVVTAWMASPTHRENLLNNRYSDIGIAVVDGKLGGRETTLVVQMFATRISASPAVGGSSSTALGVKPAKAAETLPVPVPTAAPTLNSELKTMNPRVSPFDITKALSIGMLAVFVIVLLADVIQVSRHKIVRWTSKSFAHLAFMLILLLAAVMVNRGLIL